MIPSSWERDRERLGQLFHLTPTGIQFRGAFPDYLASAQVTARGTLEARAKRLTSRLDHIVHDLWNLVTIIRHSEWMRGLSSRDTIWKPDWMGYAALDVEHFYVQSRSLLDHVAEWLQIAGEKPEQTSGSFEGLLSKVDEPRTRAALGEAATDVVRTAKWFEELRRVRDRSVHSGAWTVVIPTPEEGIKFQTYSSFPFEKPLISFEEKENEFQEFRAFASATVGRVVLLLEDLAAAVRSIRPMQKVDGGYISAPGFSDFLEWCEVAPMPDENGSSTLTILTGQGSERRRIGVVPGDPFTYTRSRIYVSDRTGRRLIALFGNGYGNRVFDIVRGEGIFLNCRIVEMGMGVRMVSSHKGFVSGHCTIEFENERIAPDPLPPPVD